MKLGRPIVTSSIAVGFVAVGLPGLLPHGVGRAVVADPSGRFPRLRRRRLGTRTKVYSRYYDPFAYFASVSAQPADRSRIVSFKALRRDLATRDLPRFAWIAPDLAHDGLHGSLRESDRYLSKL